MVSVYREDQKIKIGELKSQGVQAEILSKAKIVSEPVWRWTSSSGIALGIQATDKRDVLL